MNLELLHRHYKTAERRFERAYGHKPNHRNSVDAANFMKIYMFVKKSYRNYTI